MAEPGGSKGAGRGAPRRDDEPTSIGDLVRRLLRSPAHRDRRALYAEVGPLLKERLGEALAEDLAPLSLRSGTLTLGIKSAALLHEIAAFRRDDLLAFLQSRLGPARIRDIRLRHTPS